MKDSFRIIFRSVILSLTLFFTLFISIIYSNAQITKGTFRIGPEIAFDTFEERVVDDFDEYNSSKTLFCASFGYYIINNLEVGIKTSQYVFKEEADLFDSKYHEQFNSLNATYMINPSENFYVPISFSLGLVGTKFTNDNNDEIKFNGNGFAIGTGMEYQVSNKIGARLFIEHRSLKLDENNDDIAEEFLRTLEWKKFVMTFGINFYIGKKSTEGRK